MIGVYLRPDITQVVRARLRKKAVLEIQEARIITQSYLPALNFKTEADVRQRIEDMAYCFSDIREQVSGKREGMYLVLPDYLFSMIDCFRYETEADIEERICQWTQKELGEVCYAKPITTSPEPQQHYVTVAVLDRRIADVLAEAAAQENMQLMSVEPASISFLRCTGVFNKEELVLHAFNEHATLVGYSSNGGLFKMDVPDLAVNSLGNLPKEDAERQIQSKLIAFESTAHQTFEFLNQGLPYTILAKPIFAQSFDTLRERKAEPQYFPEFINSGEIMDSEQEEWMCAVGTMVQDVDFSADCFMEVIDGYETITSGNVLPNDIQRETKSYQRLQDVMKYTKLGIIGLAVISVIELGGIFFLQSTEIPDGLEADYQAAQATIEDINAELELIQIEQKEHEYPLEAYSGAVHSLPEGVGFISFEAGNNTHKKSDEQWIRLKAVTTDPLKLQDYVGRLSQNAIFSGVMMPEFSTDNATNYKTAQIVIGKGAITP